MPPLAYPQKCPSLALTSSFSKQKRKGVSAFLALFLSLLVSFIPVEAATTVALSSTWKFGQDPTNIGASQTYHWYTDTFDDSAWPTIQSGKSWESQPAGLNSDGTPYAGYAWYRQTLTVPAAASGAPMTLTLASISSDDELYFNGVHIAGIEGNYKYNNRLLRIYTIPASSIRFGQANTLAIRVWGGNLEFLGRNSGLVAGTYTVVLDLYHAMARNPGGSITSEKPVELWDFGTAQQGKAFELVFRIDPTVLGGVSANLAYTLKDFYGVTIKTGTVAVVTGTDGIPRGVVSIDAPTSQVIYFGGRFTAGYKITNASSGATLFDNTASPLKLDNLTFTLRDEAILATLPATTESTPYGNLSLIDTIDCSTEMSAEIHPYMQSAFGNHAQDYMTPGVATTVSVNTILGKQARETTYGWFAYRIGRGKLTPGNSYLVRIEYAEDKPRYCPVEIQVGQNYMDVGWKNGISSTDVYDNWPLSNAYQTYDVVVPLGDETTAAGGTGDGNAQKGFWIYFMDKRKPNYYFYPYSGGPAISTIKLYSIDATANAPTVTLPAGLPQRVLTFDWERQPTSVPTDLVKYAKLMGYSAISPLTLKWTFANYADPVAGFDSENVDAANYWVTGKYSIGSGVAPDPAVPGKKSQHYAYLAATKNSGINYIPRFEYQGSYDLPTSAQPIGPDGSPAIPNRQGLTGHQGANFLNSLVYSDMKKFMDSLIKPYAATNPQLTGAVWRMRTDRMQTSYGPNDIDLFCSETGTTKPAGYSNAQLAAWASTGPASSAYATWWHGKRADFHQQIVSLMKSYRSDLTLYYYNWDEDKFSMRLPDLNASAFTYNQVSLKGGATAYANNKSARATFTGQDYIDVMTSGDFSDSFGASTSNPQFFHQPSYGLRPNFYGGISGIQLLAPVNWLCYANKPDYINYFQTADGLAVSNCVSYDEIASREPNPKYEGNMVLPGGGPFSMAMELLSYYHGDARTLTYTVYTYGRGYADAHRRFAQAFRALPAVTGTIMASSPTDTAVRTYATANGTYVGVAFKGYAASTFTVKVPGAAGKKVTNLVTNTAVTPTSSGADLTFTVVSGPMELNAYLVK